MTRKPNKKGPRRHVLSDHKKRGKAYIPPFVDGLRNYPNFQGHTWHDDVLPELMWIALLYQAEPTRAGELAAEVVRAARVVHHGRRRLPFAMTSAWSALSAAASKRVRALLQKTECFEVVSAALAPLVVLYPQCPMTPIFRRRAPKPSDEQLDAHLAQMGRAAEKLLIRRTRDAALIQGIAVFAMAASGSMSPNGLVLQDLPLLTDYPTTPESKRIEQRVRLTSSMLARTCEQDSGWREYFWRRGFALSPCLVAPDRFHAGVHDTMETAELILSALETLSASLEKEFEAAWTSFPVDLASPMKSQVIGGLLARQVRYVRHMLITPRLLCDELGQPLLRSMVESAITSAWLIRNGQPADLERYVLFGLGQEKLALEHLSATAETSVFLEERRQREIAVRTEWLDGQRFRSLLPVDVSSSWMAPRSLRDLAEQVDMIDLYNTVYTSTSAQVHGSWNAVGRTALRYCFNPLHRLHMVPDIESTRMDLMMVLTALRILARSWEVTREWASDMLPCASVSQALREVETLLDGKSTEQGAPKEE